MEKTDNMVPVVHPQTGEVIPTNSPTAKRLIAAGWQRAEEAEESHPKKVTEPKVTK